MSNLAEKVREKVRGRSKPRAQPDPNDTGTAGNFYGSSTANKKVAESSTDPRLSSPTIPAWHIHKGSVKSSGSSRPGMPSVDSFTLDTGMTARRNESNISLPTENNTIPTSTDDYTLTSRTDYSVLTPETYYKHFSSTDTDKIPVRSLSLSERMPDQSQRRRSPVADQRAYETLPQGSSTYPYTVPRRKESLPQNRAQRRNRGSADRKKHDLETTALHERPHPSAPEPAAASLPPHTMGTDLGDEINQALASLAVDEGVRERDRQSERRRRSASAPSEPLEHLRLPPNFNLGTSERTTIDTEWKPAVTQENVHHQRTEVVQEAITRDIHIHHYYTYLQPIKVLEILPAKHYRLDPETGEKVEIPAPPGWVMPEHLRPRTEDASAVKGYTRHYLVNEKHPRGVLEAPPGPGQPGSRPNQLMSSNQTVRQNPPNVNRVRKYSTRPL